MSDKPESGGNVVLIVEDDPVQLEVMRAMVRKLGMGSVPASTLVEARKHLQDERVRIVLLGLRLQDGTALDVLHALAHESVPRALIIASGCDERTRHAVSRLAQEHGIFVAGSLAKPLRPEDLAALLRAQPAGLSAPLGASEVPVESNDVMLAFAGGQIVPYYQPKVSLSTGGVVGVEALARWESATDVSIGPARFMPVIERMGQAPALAQAMLRASMAACARWRRRFPGVSVAVNISPRFIDTAFVDLVRQCLDEYGIPPSLLVLEITEQSALSESPRVGELLTRLRIDGVELSIDDFGTGYSSLLALLKIPFNEMKLDRHYVAGSLRDADSARVLKALIPMSREMGLRTVAEGIESIELRDRLAAYGCSAGQGWLWSKALSEGALHGWLDDAARSRRGATWGVAAPCQSMH